MAQGFISGGVSGFSGYSGVSGYSGYSGVSGYSGYSGVSGYSGYSGFQGPQGAAAGPLNLNTVTVNAATLSASNDMVMCDASQITIPSQMLFLYTAVGNTGRRAYFKKIDTSIRTISISGNGTQTIDGFTSFVLTDQNQGITIVSDGTNWQRLE